MRKLFLNVNVHTDHTTVFQGVITGKEEQIICTFEIETTFLRKSMDRFIFELAT